MLEKYKTVQKESQAEIVERKSRFIASVCPVDTEEEAQNFITKIKKLNKNARHNVFAYIVLNEDTEVQRYSDDGEPNQTAGLPILDLLKGEEIKNVVIVVTRYFGGILLGTGGLVRAYGHSAKEALQKAEIIEKILLQEINITVDYSLSGKIQYMTMQEHFIIEDTIYTDLVKFIIFVPVQEAAAFKKAVVEATSDQAVICIGGKIYKDISPDRSLAYRQ